MRWKPAIRNHVFCALRALTHLEVPRSRGLIASWYEFKRHFADQAITNFIRQTVTDPHRPGTEFLFYIHGLDWRP